MFYTMVGRVLGVKLLIIKYLVATTPLAQQYKRYMYYYYTMVDNVLGDKLLIITN